MAIHDTIIATAPQGANVRAISFETGRNTARVRVEGPNAEDFLKRTLQATDVVELMNAHEAHGHKGGS